MKARNSMIISVLNQKGGVGKTTLSIHIASTIALAGYSVLLIDADVQRSALDWAATRDKEPLFNVVGIPSSNIHKEVKMLEPKYDYIIIDGPPRVYDVAKAVIAASDYVVIPVQPSPYDVWSAEEIVNLINEVKTTLAPYKKIDAGFVINRKIANSVIGRDVTEALGKYPFPVLEASIHQRVAFTETAAQGSSAIEEDPDSIAGKEIKALVEEILSKINSKIAAA
jgi:chromosome partitioning protein